MVWTENSIFYLPPSCRGIGDNLQFTRLPEFYYNKFNKPFTLYADDKHKIWRTIPHVLLFNDMPNKTDNVIDLWFNKIPSRKGPPVYRQLSKFVPVDEILPNIKPLMLVSPAKGLLLPIDENYSNVIIICTEGAKREQLNWCRKISEEISSFLYEKLKNEYTFVQVGGLDNYKISGAIDRRGLTVSKTFQIMLKGRYFIGVNSGMMHLANCVPWIDSFIYLECPVDLPIADNDISIFPTNEWLYDDSIFFSYKRWKNVSDQHFIVDYLRRRAHGRNAR